MADAVAVAVGFIGPARDLVVFRMQDKKKIYIYMYV